MSDQYPKRGKWSGSGPDNRDPQLIGGIVSKIAANQGWSKHLADDQIFSRWEQLVGQEIASHVTPIDLHNGILTVRADSTAWATQLQTLRSELIRQINSAIKGARTVRGLTIEGPQTPSWRHGPRHVEGRGPRDTYG